tara:strand:+ start:174 stop:503 length:330 start_codon:yes stop_codon:yes gene_type:complete
MRKYKLYHSSRFDRELSKLTKEFQQRIDKIEDQLINNPYIGKPLNLKWFREKKLEKYRIYYLIYDNLNAIFMVAISDKKDQQKVINTIRLLLEFFRKELDTLIDRKDLD